MTDAEYRAKIVAEMLAEWKRNAKAVIEGRMK